MNHQLTDLLFEGQKEVTPYGSQTLSKCPNRYVEGPYPKLLNIGQASHVWDYDGNEYIDFIASLGATSVGYCDPTINQAIIHQLEQGALFSLPNALEGAVARRLCEIAPFTDMWKFFTSGSEACAAAVKVARAYTGRQIVVTCGYHGWMDWYTIANDKKAGIPPVLGQYVSKAKYNDIESFAALINEQTACVIMEPMSFEWPKEGFLQAVRELCTKNGAHLILDEVVTGGRTEGFFAANHFGVVPDLITAGKALANGLHMGAVGAARPIAETFERDDFFASGTYGGSCLSLRASAATMAVLVDNIPRMVEHGQLLAQAFNTLFPDARCEGYPTRTQFVFPTVAHKAFFWQECVKRGVLFGYSNFTMASHDSDDLLKTVDVMTEVSRILKQFWNDPLSKLEGKLPVEALRLRS